MSILLTIVFCAVHINVIASQAATPVAGMDLIEGVELSYAIQQKNFCFLVTQLKSKCSKYLTSVNTIIKKMMTTTNTIQKLSEIKSNYTGIYKMLSNYSNEFQDIYQFMTEKKLIQKQTKDEIDTVMYLSKKLNDVIESYKDQNQFTTSYSTYKTNYESKTKFLSTSLYQIIANANEKSEQQSIVQAAIIYSMHDRLRVQRFMIGITQLYIQEAVNDIAYKSFTNTDTTGKIQEYVTRLILMQQEMTKVDQKVVNSWFEESVHIIKSLILKALNKKQYRNTINKELAETLYKQVTQRYYWREWFVLVYNDIAGFDKHAVGYCNGHHFFNINGKNVVVATSSKDNKFNIQNAKTLLDSIKEVKSSALDLFNVVIPSSPNCNDYSFIGVIGTKDDAWGMSQTTRRTAKKIGDFNVILFA